MRWVLYWRHITRCFEGTHNGPWVSYGSNCPGRLFRGGESLQLSHEEWVCETVKKKENFRKRCWSEKVHSSWLSEVTAMMSENVLDEALDKAGVGLRRTWYDKLKSFNFLLQGREPLNNFKQMNSHLSWKDHVGRRGRVGWWEAEVQHLRIYQRLSSEMCVMR